MKKVYLITPEWPGVEGYDFKIDIDFDSKEAAENYCKEHSVSYYYIEEVIPHRELFFKDIMARIPYGVKFRFEISGGEYKTVSISEVKDMPSLDPIYSYWMRKGYYLPYLRPLSSMTEEERLDLARIGIYIDNGDIMFDAYDYRDISLLYIITPYIDWLNQHHFDYRDLIGKGLALEAPENMYQ